MTLTPAAHADVAPTDDGVDTANPTSASPASHAGKSPEPSLSSPIAAFAVVLAVVGGGALVARVTDHGVVVPLVGVALLAILAAVVDARDQRIPNTVVLAVFAVVAVGVPLVAVVDDRSLWGCTRDVGVGLLLSGAPLMFITWLVRPATVGGGDWKLLSVLGAAVGLLAPLAALLIVVSATPVHAGIALARRERREVPLGPGLAVGFLAAIAVATLAPDLVGGFYA